ncbi:MAG: PD40 domain-containing protein [Polyangiaceae bacterium]|nr:PD40 domain-containing protein [Polyangiaceae bacterium]
MRRASLSLGSLVVVGAVIGFACGSSSDSAGTGGSGGDTTTTTTTTTTSGTGGGFIDHGAVVSIAIAPPSVTIDVQNGVSAPVWFTVMATYADTTTAEVPADWLFDRPDLAGLSNQGELSAHGTLGGKGTATATVGALSATADVTVVLHLTQNPAGLAASDQALFDSPDGNPSGTLLYPYDHTVFARGILAPELMWNGGSAGDAYRVHLHEQYFDAVVYTSADPPSDFSMDPALFAQLTDSNAGELVTVDIRRLSGGQAHAPMAQSWKIAQGSLRGTIYYWAVNTGQLMKINPGASSPVVVFDSGPADQLGSPAPANYNGATPPWESGGNNKRCVACHTVSKDGSTIAGVFEKLGSTASPWGTIDLTLSPPGVVQMTPYDSSAIYLGITPDGDYVVENDVAMRMRLKNALTGATVPSALDAFGDSTCDPAFSPDGKLLAFSSNVSGYYPVEFYRSDLDVIDFDQGSLAFANRRTIALGGANALAFPSFSPDSAWVLYQGGDYSRAKYGANLTGHNDLFITDVAGVAGSTLLAEASGATLEPRNQHIAYQPTVNPIAVGGYLWVVFMTPRDYGNKMQSSADPTYENRKQLWVAAVDVNPQPGQDPSHPAFWLPGQDLSTVNMSGYWALDPCKQQGNSCNEGFECCTGFCQPDGNGDYVCIPPPGGCSHVGEACTTGADCCGSPDVVCIGGFCALGQPN